MKTNLRKTPSSLFGRKKDESGAAAVEFALLLPLLITFLCGVVVYGYMLSMQQSVTAASVEGARATAVASPEKTDSDRVIAAKRSINNTMRPYGAQCGTNGLSCTVTIQNCPESSKQRCATVKVSYNWGANPKVPLIPLLPAPDKIEHTIVVEVN